MSFSYDPTKLDVPLNHVRLLTSDTIEDDHFLDDEEVNGFVAAEKNDWLAAAAACEAIALRVGREKGVKGETTWDPKEKHDQYKAMAREYRKRGSRPGSVYAGGISQADAEAVRTDPDAVQPSFTSMTHTNTAAGPDAPDPLTDPAA